MKTNFTRLLVCFILLIGISCNQEHDAKPEQLINLRFETENSGLLLVENVKVLSGKLISKNLQAINAIHGVTGQKIIAYTVKPTSLPEGRAKRVFVERCYVFTGRCFEYGTLVTDTDSGVQIFFPADVQTKLLGFPDRCPGDDSEWS